MARVPREVMEAQLREFESHHVALLRSLSGLPTGESITAPLFDSAALSRVASAQGRLLSLLRALGDAAEPGRGTGASITAGLQPGMSFRSASAVPLGAMEELLDRLREMAANGEVHLYHELEIPEIDKVIETGIKNLGMYDAKRPLYKTKDDFIMSEDFNLLFFYHNRIEGYGLAKYI